MFEFLLISDIFELVLRLPILSRIATFVFGLVRRIILFFIADLETGGHFVIALVIEFHVALIVIILVLILVIAGVIAAPPVVTSPPMFMVVMMVLMWHTLYFFV